MKKKLLENDSFYLALFVCVCMVAIGGVWFTKNNVDELASNNEFTNDASKNNENDELHLIQKDSDDAIPTSTESNQNLEKARDLFEKCPPKESIDKLLKIDRILFTRKK